MNTKIPPGLKTLFLVHFILGLALGLVYVLIPEPYFKLFNWQIDQPIIYRLLGSAILGFAAGSWFGFKAVDWEQVRIVVLTELVWPPLGAIINLLGILRNEIPPLIGWINFVVLGGFAVAFYLYYNQQEGAAAVKAPAPKVSAPRPAAKKAARRGRGRG